MTTDNQGQAVFDVPFAPPAGLPAVTATATDSLGSTSEVSALRRATLEAPTQAVRLAPGQTVTFSAATSDAITLRDPDAGPLDPPWRLTLSASAGILTLASTAGLTGSGNGTGSVSYSGPLNALDAALTGLCYTAPLESDVLTVLSVNAQSSGSATLQVNVVLSDGVFVVNTTADSGPGSLRQAILDSDTVTGGGNTIDFTIPGQGVHSIALDSPLPAVTSTVVIDGTSQPGYTGAPLIQLNVQDAGTTDGLSITGSDVTLRGLMTDGFSFGSSTDSASVTLPSVALPPSSAGAVATYRIDTIAAGELVAVVTPQGLTTELSLLDSQGDVLVQSDGLSPAVPDDVIDQHVPPGTYFLRVNRTAGEGTYTLTTMVSLAAAPFEPIPVGSGSFAVTAGDFNGDGKLDLAVAAEFSNGVSVLLGNGDGTFQPAVEYAVGQEPDALVAGDFNGDGKLDLAVANWNPLGDGNVSVLLGNGDGTFQAAQQYAVGGYPSSIVAGDFNGDGKLDLAVADEGNELGGAADPGGVSVLLDNGDGTFEPAVYYAVGPDPNAIVAGDFTSDGRTDLAVSDSDGVQILLGNGDGTFQPASTVAAGTRGVLVAGDFNGDGHTDLAVAPNYSGVSVLLGNGDGTFQPQVTYSGGGYPFLEGDFNGDGRPDLAAVNGAGAVSVLLGNGDGTFVDAGQFATTPHATPLVADVNGDGTDDVLVINSAGDILYRLGIPGHPGTFEPPVTVNPGYPSRDITWVPNTGQGQLLASVDARDDAVSLYAWRYGGFVRVGSLATGHLPAQIIAADLNDNGWDDLVVRNAGDGSLSIYFNASDATVPVAPFDGPLTPVQEAFGFRVTLPAGLGVSDVQAVDTTGTGRLDLVVTNELTGQVSILRNLGDETFGPPAPYRGGTALSGLDTSSGTPEVTSLEATASVAAGALVTGGPTDLVTANPGSSSLGLLVGLGGPVRQSRCHPDAEPGPGNPRGRLHERRHSRPSRPHEQRAEHLPQQW